MDRRKFFGFLFGAAAVGAVAPKVLAQKTRVMDEMLKRSEETCRIEAAKAINEMIKALQPTPPNWKAPPPLPLYASKIAQSARRAIESSHKAQHFLETHRNMLDREKWNKEWEDFT